MIFPLFSKLLKDLYPTFVLLTIAFVVEGQFRLGLFLAASVYLSTAIYSQVYLNFHQVHLMFVVLPSINSELRVANEYYTRYAIATDGETYHAVFISLNNVHQRLQAVKKEIESNWSSLWFFYQP